MNDDGEELAGGSMDMGFLGSLEPSFHDEVSTLLLAQLGDTSYNKSQSYGREKRRAVKEVISEIYSLRVSRPSYYDQEGKLTSS